MTTINLLDMVRLGLVSECLSGGCGARDNEIAAQDSRPIM